MFHLKIQQEMFWVSLKNRLKSLQEWPFIFDWEYLLIKNVEFNLGKLWRIVIKILFWNSFEPPFCAFLSSQRRRRRIRRRCLGIYSEALIKRFSGCGAVAGVVGPKLKCFSILWRQILKQLIWNVVVLPGNYGRFSRFQHLKLCQGVLVRFRGVQTCELHSSLRSVFMVFLLYFFEFCIKWIFVLFGLVWTELWLIKTTTFNVFYGLYQFSIWLCNQNSNE